MYFLYIFIWMRKKTAFSFVHTSPCIWGCDWISNIYCCCSQEWWTRVVGRKSSLKSSCIWAMVLTRHPPNPLESKWAHPLQVLKYHYLSILHILRLFFTNNSNRNFALLGPLCFFEQLISLHRVLNSFLHQMHDKFMRHQRSSHPVERRNSSTVDQLIHQLL